MRMKIGRDIRPFSRFLTLTLSSRKTPPFTIPILYYTHYSQPTPLAP